MEIICLLIGLIVGLGVAVWLRKSVRDMYEQRLATTEAAKESLRTQLETVQTQTHTLQEELIATKMMLSSTQAQLEGERTRNDAEMKMRKEQFDQQLKTVQEQFSNLATQVLDRASSKLKVQNSESMEHITQPLKERLAELQQAIQTTNQESAKNTASLTEQLKSMAEQADKIGQTATRLTNVMRGANKVQGNWGELILSEILDAQGLRQGLNYDVQQVITDDKGNIVTNAESGKRMIPDVVMHYPNNEDVVIDSKMSVDAYYQYVNTEDHVLKKKFADDLVRSVRTQVTTLAKKDYSSYIKKPRRAIDFVIMFVPNEGALQLALATEPKLWSEAFEKQVFLTSQQNLIAILKMIEIAWRQYAQTENQKRVFDMAEEMLKRVGEFIKRFDMVGADIAKLQADYDSVCNKVHTGRQSIVQKANELKTLGVKENAKLPIPETAPSLDETE